MKDAAVVKSAPELLVSQVAALRVQLYWLAFSAAPVRVCCTYDNIDGIRMLCCVSTARCNHGALRDTREAVGPKQRCRVDVNAF